MEIKSPFKFLDSYTREDHEIFFGREQEINELYRRVFESKILLVYGISGTGKSSLIHCGLANKIQESDWLPINVRRGGDILSSMGSNIQNACLSPLKETPATASQFKKAVRSLYLDYYKPIFFIFDQFEELFIFGSKEEQKSLVQVIKSLADSELQCRFIFVMREEYLAGITELEKTIPNFLANRVRIEHMSFSNAKDAVEGPCKVANIALEEGFADSLLERLSPESTEVELTYLQVFLDKIYRLSMEERPDVEESRQNLVFNKELLHRTGNVSDLLGSFLDEQIAQLTDPDSALAVLKSFVSVKGTKRQMRSEEVQDYALTLGKPIEAESLRQLIHTFIHLRILRDKDQNGRYELLHDALAQKIYEKITLVEKELLEVRQFVENAYANFEKRKLFLGQDDLKYIAPYADKLFVNKKLSEFIDGSRKNINAKKRAFSQFLTFSAIGFFVIIIAVVLYYFRSSVSAKSDELTIQSFLQQGFSPSLSFRTAMAAYKKDTNSTIAIKAMFDSFYELLENGPYYDSLNNEINPQKAIFNFTPCTSNIIYARFSKDGKYIYGYLEDNTIDIWDISGKLLFSKRENHNSILALSFAPCNEYLSATYKDSTAIVWKINGEEVFKAKVAYDILNPLDVINFSSKKDIISYLPGNNKINIYNLKDSTYYELEGHKAEVNGAVFSPDGKFCASASRDSSVIIWMFTETSHIYKKVNRIKDFHGIVWSVDFAENSQYVLCFSDCDQPPLTIRRLTGENILKYRFRDIAFDPHATHTYEYFYNEKFYSAQFIAGDAAIRISTYSDRVKSNQSNNYKDGNLSGTYNYFRIIFSGHTLFLLNQENKNLGGFDEMLHNSPNVKAYLDISRKYIAKNKVENNFSTLYYYDRLPIRKFKGIQPCFAPDGNYMLCLVGENLKLYPVEEKELISLALKKSIFGNLDRIQGEWAHSSISIYF